MSTERGKDYVEKIAYHQVIKECGTMPTYKGLNQCFLGNLNFGIS